MPRRISRRLVVTSLALVASITVAAPGTASAAAGNPWPFQGVGGFSNDMGDGFWVAFANGQVVPYGGTSFHGDASSLPLSGPITGGTGTRDGLGYWLVGTDGGVFTYGSARFFGSMGGTRLDQPVFSIAQSGLGSGYWLVARDGGIFSFGDARFYGSAAPYAVRHPIVGISMTQNYGGYRLIGRDGGIFSFGQARFYGSLPGIGVHVDDVVGMATTPSGRGYWIARANGEVYAFGDARAFAHGHARDALYRAPTLAGDPWVGIFSNSNPGYRDLDEEWGYRLVARSGRTIAVGDAPGGARATNPYNSCPRGRITVQHPSGTPNETAPDQWELPWTLPLRNDANGSVRVPAGAATIQVMYDDYNELWDDDQNTTGVTLAPGASGSVSGEWTGSGTEAPRPFLDDLGADVNADWTQSTKCPPPGRDL